ncbi:hypothetical protein BREU_1403 [Bifidobacterium reuteri DSM 23975]|uniref:Uncharacterized protein n=1 Tax=Bifidobacterium reuteri DSM 23975 TaxID=1437610 RepID=A0A087CSI0_9BIFI|nr:MULTISPECIES: hypothetical protein [Bifidobacterium]KFI86230.1 hypothetical protein BREU_1403 [Bifidobacterium reuteri DSM 23975]
MNGLGVFVVGYMLTLLATGVFIILLACVTAGFMRFLHREFDWNPLSRRSSTPGRTAGEKKGGPEGRTWEKTPVNRWESTESKRESVTTL